MTSILVSHIPDTCTREDIILQVHALLPKEHVDYILYPLGRDNTRALISLKTKTAAELILKHQLQVLGASLKCKPAPRQTYQKCTAEVDPLTVASIPDLEPCITSLQQEFGVDVTFEHSTGLMVLSGSLLQIQCAQTKLDAIYREQQEAQARELLMVEQDLATPRSQRSLSLESNQQRSMNGGVTGPIQSSSEPQVKSYLHNKNLVPERHVYSQKAGTSFDSRSTYKASTIASVAKHVTSEQYNHPRPSSSMSTPAHSNTKKPSTGLNQSLSGSKSHRGVRQQDVLPQGVFDDAGFTIRGVKIHRHMSSEEEKSPEPLAADKEDNPLRHTMPAQAWTSGTNNSSLYVRAHRHQAQQPLIPHAKQQVKLGKDGKEYLSLSIELDGDVMGYIKKIHKPEIKHIELKNQVQFSNRWGEEVMEVRITTALTEQEGGQKKLSNAREEFVGFYQTVFYSVVKDCVEYNVEVVSESEVDAVTTAVGKAFASRVYVSNRNQGEIILVGSYDYLPLVKEWVNKKLLHTGSLIQRSQNAAVSKPSLNTWVGQPTQRLYSDRLSSTMPIKASVAEGQVRSHKPREDLRNETPSYYEHHTREGLKVLIYAADITHCDTEVIVNPANDNLHHIGAVAAAISSAAGPQLQEQCFQHVQNNGPLQVSELMSTPGGGTLKCSHVIHCVGPMWSLYTNKTKCSEVLKQAFLNALFYANNKLKAKSLAMPAIGTGIFGVPLDVCTRSMYDAIVSFSRAASSLQEVHVVDLADEAAGMMSVIFTQLADGDCGDEGQELQVEELEETLSQTSSLGRGIQNVEDFLTSVDDEQSLLHAASMELQHASAPPVLGGGLHRQETREEGPLSPPPSPDSDYEQPVPRRLRTNTDEHNTALIQPARAADVQATAALIQPTRAADVQATAASLSPRADSQHSSPTPLSVHSDHVTPRERPETLGDITPRSNAGQSKEMTSSIPSIRSGNVTPHEQLQSGKSSVASIRSGNATPRSGMHIGNATPRSGMQSGNVTPRSGMQSGNAMPRNGLQSGNATPRIVSTEDQQVKSLRSGHSTPRSVVRSGTGTPKADRITSGNVTPREQLNSEEGTPRLESIHSGNITPRDLVQSGEVTPIGRDLGSEPGTPRSGSVISPSHDLESPFTSPRQPHLAVVQPQEVTEVKAGIHLPQGMDESDGSRQSTAMQEPLPETEAQLLARVRLEEHQSTPENSLYRPGVKSPSSEVFNEKEMESAPLLIKLVASTYCMAEKAAEIIRDVMKQGELGIVEKGVNDLQTQADRSAERCIVASLYDQFPGITVIGEESSYSADEEINPDWIERSKSVDVLQYLREVPDDLRNIDLSDVVVWVDPLDGTSEYTQGLLDHVTTLIGIAVKGRAVAGVICQPFYNYQSGPDAVLGRVIWGVIGVGAFGFTLTPASKDENIVCTTRSHSNRIVNMSVDACQPTQVMRVGGSGHKVLLLLEGHAHAYVFASPGTKKWDTCAPEAVLHAVGGKLTDMHSNSFQYDANVQRKNAGGVLATLNEEAHSLYASKIPQEVLNELHTEGTPVWQLANQLTARLNKVNAPLVLQILAASVCIAKRSGDIIRDIMKQGELGIVEKGVNDLQTEADRAAQRCILASLRKQFSGITVVGEEEENESVQCDWVECSQAEDVLQLTNTFPENLKNVELKDVVVWVDPIDGTAEYTQGLLDHVTTLIGIAVNGRAVAGVVYQPFYNYQSGPNAELGRCIYGVVGQGVYGFKPKSPPAGENVICTTRSHSNNNVNMTIEACNPTNVLRVGGSGHKALLILEGFAHAYVFATPGTKKWDTCAPEAILHAQGGLMTDMYGNHFQYFADVQQQNKAGVLATPVGVSHRWYSERIPPQVKENLFSEGPAPWQTGSDVIETPRF